MRRPFVLCAIVLVAACSQKPDPKTLASWSATLQLAAERWLTSSVPSSFVRATVKAARKEFDSAADDDQFRDVVKQLDAASGNLTQAIEKNDRRTVAECARRFAAATAALQKMKDQKQ